MESAGMLPIVNTLVVNNWWIFIFVILIGLHCFIFLICSRTLSTEAPANYILLSIFTLCESFSIGAITSFYDPISVLIAVLMTLGVTLGLTAYTMCAKQNYRTWLAIPFSYIFNFGVFGVILAIFYDTYALDALLWLVWSFLYSFFLVIDTKFIIEEGTYGLTNDDYIAGALCVYIDIVRILIIIVISWFTSKKNEDF